MPTLVECLNAETVDALKRRLTGLSFSGSTALKKLELVNLINKMLEIEQLKTYWCKLSVMEKNAISEVVFGPHDTFIDAQFYSKYQRSPVFSKGDTQYSYSSTPTLLGAFFFHQYLPTDLQDRFSSFIEKPSKAMLSGVQNLPEISGLKIRNMEMTALAEVKAVLRLIDKKSLKMSDKTKFPSASALKSVETILNVGDYFTEEDKSRIDKHSQEIGPIRSFAWLMLVQAGKLANLSGTTLQLTAMGKKALLLPSEEILKRLWDSWLITNLLDEFRRIDVIKGQTGKGKRDFTDPKMRRQVIQTILYETPTHTWIKFNDFSRYMLSQHATFDITQRDPWHLYICEPQYGSLGNTGGWNVLQDRYMLCFLFEYAATLGMIDIAYVSPNNAKDDYKNLWGSDYLSFFSRYDGLLYFKINRLGEYCLKLENRYQTNQPEFNIPDIQVTEEGLIKTPSSDITSEIIIILDQFCNRKDSHTWLLSQESLMSALDGGHKLSQFCDFILKFKIHLPRTLADLIQELELKSTHIKLKDRVILFECALHEVARIFVNHPKINRYCSLIGHKLLAVPEKNLSKFQAECKKIGYVINV